MDVKENNCRICWEENVEFSWDDLLPGNSSLTYKDCYYKYTQLKYLDDDNFSNMLCHDCSDGLEYIDAFISRAIEANAKLLEICDLNLTNNKSESPSSSFETVSLEIEIKHEIEGPTINEATSIELLTLPAENKNVLRSEQHQGPDEINDKKQCNNKFHGDKIYNVCNKKTKAKTGNPRRNVTKMAIIKNATEEETSKKSSNVKQTKCTATVINENICEESELILDNPIESKLRAKTENKSLAIGDKTKTKQFAKLKRNNWQGSQPCLCQYCPMEVKGLTNIKRHEAIHNEKRKRTETCPKCGVKFFTKGSLRIHMNTHDENRQKQFKCEFCDKAFFNRGTLNVHRRIHLGLMVKCQICSKEYYRKVELYKHMNTHASTLISVEAKKRPRYMVRCKYCDKEILSTSFKSHTAAHLNQPLMKCSICNKEYFNRGSCREHIKTIHKKTTEELNDYIISYEKNRLLHLYLRQKTDLQLDEV